MKSADIALIKVISNFPRIVEQAAVHMRATSNSILFKGFSFYHFTPIGAWEMRIVTFRVINTEDIDTSMARVALIRSVGITISEGLRLLGIEALDELR